jgi:hypothetical protein
MAGNINKLRDQIATMMGSGMKNSPSAKSRVKTKAKSKRMQKMSTKNC